MIDNSSTPNQSDKILNIFLEKSSHIHVFYGFFLKATVHKWARRGINNCPNDMNRRALEKGGLGASFELYDESTTCLNTVLSSFKE